MKLKAFQKENLKIWIPAGMLLLLLLLFFGGILMLRAKAGRITYDEPYHSELTGDAGTVNVLLLGTDLRLPGTEDPGRCDCTMLCSFDLRKGRIRLVSFERGISVPVNAWQWELLTGAYRYVGAGGMVKIIEACFGIPVDGYAHVDFDTFMAVVDALGGVNIRLTEAEAAALNGETWNSTTYASVRLQEGLNHVNGNDALLYARLRSPDDDWARQQRQRNVMESLIKQLKTMSVFRLNRVLNDALPFINTSVPKATVNRVLASSWKFLLNGSITQLQVPEKNYDDGIIRCDFTEQSARIKDFLSAP